MVYWLHLCWVSVWITIHVFCSQDYSSALSGEFTKLLICVAHVGEAGQSIATETENLRWWVITSLEDESMIHLTI